MMTATQTMLHELIAMPGYTTAYIASEIGVRKKTIDRIISKNTNPSMKTEFSLISFYCAHALNNQS